MMTRVVLVFVAISLWPCNSVLLNASGGMTPAILKARMDCDKCNSGTKESFINRQFTLMESELKNGPTFVGIQNVIVKLFRMVLDPLWVLDHPDDEFPFDLVNIECYIYAAIVMELLNKLPRSGSPFNRVGHAYPVIFEAVADGTSAHFAVALEIPGSQQELNQIMMIDVAGTQQSQRYGGYVGSPKSVDVAGYKQQHENQVDYVEEFESVTEGEIDTLRKDYYLADIVDEKTNLQAQIDKKKQEIRDQRRALSSGGDGSKHLYDKISYIMYPFGHAGGKPTVVSGETTSSDKCEGYKTHAEEIFKNYYKQARVKWLKHKTQILAYAKTYIEDSTGSNYAKAPLRKIFEALALMFQSQEMSKPWSQPVTYNQFWVKRGGQTC